MSLTGILVGGLLNLLGSQSTHNSSAANQNGGSPVQQEFQQLGQDLQTGNLSAARQDFATIEQNVRQRTSELLHHHRHFSGGSSSPVAQDFGMLAQALQSGNLSDAQSAFSNLQQILEQPIPSLDPSATAAGPQPSSNAINFLI